MVCNCGNISCDEEFLEGLIMRKVLHVLYEEHPNDFAPAIALFRCST